MRLLERLDSSGAVGLDLSPGDSLCREAAEQIRSLEEHVDALVAERRWKHGDLLDGVRRLRALLRVI